MLKRLIGEKSRSRGWSIINPPCSVKAYIFNILPSIYLPIDYNEGSCAIEMWLHVLIFSDWLSLPPGGDDCSTLSWLPLHPHWVLGLLPAVWLPSGRICGRPPSSSLCCSSFPSQNQGGTERRRSQEEGQESWVGCRAAPVNLHLTLLHHGLHVRGLPIPFLGKGQFDLFYQMRPFLLEKNGAFCIFHSTRTLYIPHQMSHTSTQPGHFKPIYIYVFLHLCSTLWGDTHVGAACSTGVHQTLFQFRKKEKIHDKTEHFCFLHWD